MSELNALHGWAEGLLNRLGPVARRVVLVEIGRKIRQNTQAHLKNQENPDGSAYVPRRPQRKNLKQTFAEHSKGAKKQQTMFKKMGKAKHLRIQSSPNTVVIGYQGRDAQLAKVHQYGGRARPSPNQDLAQYPIRQLLGLTDADRSDINTILVKHLTGR